MTAKRVITQETITVHCAQCNHQWDAPFLLPMDIDRMIRVMRGISAAGCPACDAHGKDVCFGPKIEGLTPPV